jgi:hypothetical protein
MSNKNFDFIKYLKSNKFGSYEVLNSINEEEFSKLTSEEETVAEDELGETMTAGTNLQYEDEDPATTGAAAAAMDNSMDRMMGLINQKELFKFKNAIFAVAKDLIEDGYENDDVELFLTKVLSDTVCEIIDEN